MRIGYQSKSKRVIRQGRDMRFRFALVQSISWHWAIAAFVTLASIAALTVTANDAEARRKRVARVAEAVVTRDAGEPIMAIVSIKTQQVTVYDAHGWVLRAPVSTGTRRRETPAGVFTILEKKKHHRSNLYDDARMPHMQRLTWNGIAMHGGPLPGYPASHGCIRLPYRFANKLFDKTRLGMRVIVSPKDTVPVELSHSALLVPNRKAIAAAPARAETLKREAEEATKAAKETKKAAKKSAREARAAKRKLRNAKRAKKRADSKLAYAMKMLDKAKSEKSKTRAQERKAKAAAKAAEAAKQLDIVMADTTLTLRTAASAADAAKEAERKKGEAKKAATEASLALEPVSIYISRATQKLYVRRNTNKPWPDGGVVYDSTIEVPVTIRDPDRPIGTHIFTAVARDGDGLRWTAVTIDEGDQAEDALDRIIMPQDVIDRIAPTALPRSSIVVSDEPLSRETNYRTEFVAVLNNQPKGGFKTRRPSRRVPVARGYPQYDNVFGFGYYNQPYRDTRPRKKRRRRNNYQIQPSWW